MHTFYDFVTGPLAWLSVILFLGGSAWKIGWWFHKARKSDPFLLISWSWKHVLASYAHWFVPFRTMRWRSKPVLTVVTTIFHLGVVVLPLFLTAHVVLLKQFTGIGLPSLPSGVADLLAVATIFCCAYFALRRLNDPQVAFVTRESDWLILGVVAGALVTGFLASHMEYGYRLMVGLHILFGEAFLIMIPFTRVSHMLLIPLTRGYIASEFGAVRKVRDW